MSLHKEYHKLEDGREIKFSISFNRQLTNWATSEPMKIGYRVNANPVKRVDLGNGLTIEESGAFTGFGDCLLEIDRQSKKRLQQAIDVLHSRLTEYLASIYHLGQKKIGEIVRKGGIFLSVGLVGSRYALIPFTRRKYNA